jgi:hypothetical protein
VPVQAQSGQTNSHWSFRSGTSHSGHDLPVRAVVVEADRLGPAPDDHVVHEAVPFECLCSLDALLEGVEDQQRPGVTDECGLYGSVVHGGSLRSGKLLATLLGFIGTFPRHRWKDYVGR